jgi:hypothetical protein
MDNLNEKIRRVLSTLEKTDPRFEKIELIKDIRIYLDNLFGKKILHHVRSKDK